MTCTQTHTHTLVDGIVARVNVSHPVHAFCLCSATDGPKSTEGIVGTIHADAHTHIYIHTYTLRHTCVQKKEAKRILGNNNPTHFLSFLAVNGNGLECMHAHVHA